MTERIHSPLGYLSPPEFEATYHSRINFAMSVGLLCPDSAAKDTAVRYSHTSRTGISCRVETFDMRQH